MKKIIILIVGVITITGFIVGYKCFYNKTTKNSSKTTENVSKSVETKEKSKTENKETKKEIKITQPSVRENEEKTTEKSVESQKNNIQNDINNNFNSSQNNSSNQNTSQNVIQNNTQENVVQEEQPQPQVDPNETDTSHPLYSVHHGVIEYGDYSSCTNAGYNIQRGHPDLNISHSCVEVYNISGGIKGYYLDITNEGRDANYLK